MTTKACGKCRIEKPVADFARCRSNPDGLQAWCKACHRDRYQANREQRLAQQREYREANRERRARADRAYYEANRERRLEQSRAHYAATRERRAAGARAWYEANRERVAEYGRSYREANRDAKRWAHERKLTRRREIAAQATASGPWLEGEVNFLLKHHRDWTYEEIAVALGRTVPSVAGRVQKLIREGAL